MKNIIYLDSKWLHHSFFHKVKNNISNILKMGIDYPSIIALKCDPGPCKTQLNCLSISKSEFYLFYVISFLLSKKKSLEFMLLLGNSRGRMRIWQHPHIGNIWWIGGNLLLWEKKSPTIALCSHVGPPFIVSYRCAPVPLQSVADFAGTDQKRRRTFWKGIRYAAEKAPL